VIVDEAQFLTPVQVDALALAVDEDGLDVDCFGLMTAFDASIFPGSLRLVELADETVPLQVEVVCWCGRAGLVNARIEDGTIARIGGRVSVGDIAGEGDATVYRVLCRKHWRDGDLGPAVDRPDRTGWARPTAELEGRLNSGPAKDPADWCVVHLAGPLQRWIGPLSSSSLGVSQPDRPRQCPSPGAAGRRR